MNLNEKKLNPASKTMERKGRPNNVDIYVGTRLRHRRVMLGITQEKLGTAVGLTFQQVQKYESGSNRIGAGRLYDFSQALSVPIGYFFENYESPEAPGRDLREERLGYTTDPLSKKETAELVRAYYRIADPAVRKKILDLTKALASLPEEKNHDSEVESLSSEWVGKDQK